jgi:uncharacterized protein (TIGR02391 family)
MVEADDKYRPWKVSTIEAVSQIIGSTDEGLTGGQIERELARCQLPDPGPITKARRISGALVQAQAVEKTCKPVLRFLLAVMEPQSYVDQRRVFTDRQDRLNAVLVFEGVRINDEGKVAAGAKASTLSAAAEHASSLRSELVRRATHDAVFASCTTELLERNTFHALLEATKGLADRVRCLTGYAIDGAKLATETFLGDHPRLVINAMQSETDHGEQRGFGNVVIGVFGLYRNPVAHDPRLKRSVSDEELLEALGVLSMLHRRLDTARVMP